MITLTINGQDQQVDADPATPLLWVLRESLMLTGTKYACGAGQCGACTVHLDGVPIRSCSTPIARLAGKKITTIEALEHDTIGALLQAAWVQHDVPQCGYCQSGMLMSATALLKTNSQPNDTQIDAAMNGNLCRCGTYQRIRAAIKTTAGQLKQAGKT